jgi:hypothetical protein
MKGSVLFRALSLFALKKPQRSTAKAWEAFERGCAQAGMARPGAQKINKFICVAINHIE